MVAYEIVYRHVEKLRKAHHDARIGQTVPLLPLGNRLIGIVELLRQIELRHLRLLAQMRYIFPDGKREVVVRDDFFFIHAPIICEIELFVNGSTVSRA